MRKKTALLMLFCLSLFSVAVAQETENVPASEPAPAPEPAPVQTIAEAYAQAAPTPAPAPQAASKSTEFHVGANVGLGLSQFRGHAALVSPDGTKKLKLLPSLAFSAGVISELGITELISLAPGLQYSLYRASSELSAESKGSINNKSNNNVYDDRAVIAGVYLHTLEIPVLARLHFGDIYGEIGPQLGFNLYSRIYKNANYYDPDINLIALGVVAGGGIDLSGILLGARLHFGFFDYADTPKGSPWSFEINVGKFFF
jgi:hypothetical protein